MSKSGDVPEAVDVMESKQTWHKVRLGHSLKSFRTLSDFVLFVSRRANVLSHC